MRRRATANLCKAFVLVGFLVALAAGVGWRIGGERSAARFAFCGLSAAIAVYWLGDRSILGMLGARPFALAEDPLLRSTTDKVAAQVGIPAPKLALIEDGFPRSFVVGRGPGSSTLAVSTGLLRALRREELEAVIAHELAHIRSLDVLTQTFAVLLATMLVELSRLGGYFSRALLFILGPIASAFTHALLSPRREYAADEEAGRVSNPHDLAAALLRLDRAGELVSFATSPTTEPLYPVDPFETDRLSRMFRTHPPLSERVRRLRAMDAPVDEPAAT
ncbi:MAG: M48 family metalloprotease [Thermoleophilia bacterium]|nr:M48 family metalloprotease [Thermoleophilia bacterium]